MYSHDGHFSDKENAPAGREPELKNPKRRVKPAGPGGASRMASQEVRGNENRILSPKSNNSRTYPHSPFRASPEKGQPSYLARPTSPLKPSSPLRSRGHTVSAVKDQRPPSQAQRTATRAATGPKTIRSPLSRPATRQGERKNSTGSTASSGTTVTKSTRAGTGARKATTASAAAAKSRLLAPRRHQWLSRIPPLLLQCAKLLLRLWLKLRLGLERCANGFRTFYMNA
jgi:hypothetical protein